MAACSIDLDDLCRRRADLPRQCRIELRTLLIELLLAGARCLGAPLRASHDDHAETGLAPSAGHGRVSVINRMERAATAERPAAALLFFATLFLVVLVPAAAVMDVPLPILGGVVGLLGLVVLALRPDVATLIVVAIVYSNAAVVAVRVHDVPFTLAAGSSFLLAVPMGYLLLIRRERLIIPPAIPWILGYLAVLLVSTMFARESASASQAVGTFVAEGLMLYLLIVNAVRTERMALAIIGVLLAVGAVLGALSLHQELTQSFSNEYLGFAQVGGDPTGEVAESRTAGPFDGANRYAQIMVLLLPLVFAVVWGRYSLRATMLAIGSGALISVAVALTLSRGAAVGFAMVLVLMLVLRYIKLRHVAIVGVAVIALLFAFPQFGQRLGSLDALPGVAGEGVEADGSIRSRITEMIAAALVFVDHPVIGVGPNQFPSYYIDYAEEFGLRVRTEDREAHNLYVGIAAETGVLGSFFFFGAIAVTIRELARTRARLIHVRPRLAHLAAGLMLAIVSYLTTGIFLHLAFERYLWLMLALGAAVVAIASRISVVDGAIDPATESAQRSRPERASA